MNLCLVVPHYNHSASLQAFLPRLMALGLPCFIVDDGSDDAQLAAIKRLLVQYPEAALVVHDSNQGKGAAMMSGAARAQEFGYTHMLQIDADGQHDVGDIAKFIEASKNHPKSIISGAPQFDESAPRARVYGRRVTDFWVALETWSLSIKDSLCGFRIYPLAEFAAVCERFNIGRRMEFDTDIMVRSVWLGVEVRFIDTDVIYQPGNASHFHYLRDNLRLILLHIRLMLGMLIRAPWWVVRGIGLRVRGSS